MKTVINIKTDLKLKKETQKLAKTMGIPLSLIVNNAFRKFVERRSVLIEEPLIPNTRTAKILDKAIKDIKEGKNIEGPFYSAEEFMKGLKS